MYKCNVEGCNKEFKSKASLGGHVSSHARKGRISPVKGTKGKIICCSFCGKEFSNYGIKNHIAIVHEGKRERVQGNFGKSHVAWNKGLTKETNEIVKLIGEKASKTLKGKVSYYPSDEIKEKVSNSMKKAHAEGRAHNIGKSRHNSEPSYPEKFFMEVIQNEFKDQNYIREFNIGRYSFDFAWPDKLKAIEIDGEQHERFQEYKERDLRKDEFSKSKGWEILRIKWKDLFHDTKNQIQIAKLFIDE